MNGKRFLDSNILVYAFGPFDATKSVIARKLILDTAVSRVGVISYQVLQEFMNVALKKFHPQINAELAGAYLDEVIGEMEVLPWSLDLMRHGLSIHPSMDLVGTTA